MVRRSVLAMDWQEAWSALEEPWRVCFEMAWEAYAADTIPVGAVLVDAGGTIVGRGRNRVFDQTAPPGQLAGTLLAHAEINALASAARPWFLRDCVLYTTLEPCLLCFGAAVMLALGGVRFAARDLYGGATNAQTANRHFAKYPPRVEGPLTDGWGVFFEVMHVEFWLRHDPEIVTVYDGTAVMQSAVSWRSAALFGKCATLPQFLSHAWRLRP